MRNWCRREALEQWVREAQWEARGGQRRSRKSSELHKQGPLPAPKQRLSISCSLVFPGSRENMLENLYSVNKVPDALKTVTQSLPAVVNDRNTSKLSLERWGKEVCLPFRGTALMLANQPAIITTRSQSSTGLREDIYAALDVGQAQSEALYHTFNPLQALTGTHYCHQGAHARNWGIERLHDTPFCSVFESWLFQGKDKIHKNHALAGLIIKST